MGLGSSVCSFGLSGSALLPPPASPTTPLHSNQQQQRAITEQQAASRVAFSYAQADFALPISVERCAPPAAALDSLSADDLAMFIDLSYYVNRSFYVVQEDASLAKAYTLFRTLGLRHLVVIPRRVGFLFPQRGKGGEGAGHCSICCASVLPLSSLDRHSSLPALIMSKSNNHNCRAHDVIGVIARSDLLSGQLAQRFAGTAGMAAAPLDDGDDGDGDDGGDAAPLLGGGGRSDWQQQQDGGGGGGIGGGGAAAVRRRAQQQQQQQQQQQDGGGGGWNDGSDENGASSWGWGGADEEEEHNPSMMARRQTAVRNASNLDRFRLQSSGVGG